MKTQSHSTARGETGGKQKQHMMAASFSLLSVFILALYTGEGAGEEDGDNHMNQSLSSSLPLSLTPSHSPEC